MTEQGVEYESINYIEHPLAVNDLKDLLQRAGLKPADVIRTKESAYREFIGGKSLRDDELLKLMAAHPELLQRPIVVKGGKAVLARPIENLAKLKI